MLTEKQIRDFHERGYLIADPGLDGKLLDRIVSGVWPLYDPEFQRNPRFATRVQDAWKQVDEVRQLARHPAVLKALEQLFERRPLPFQTLSFPIGTAQLAHSDTIHFNCIPHGYMVGVWVALEDIDEDNGPLIYYPGSHKLPEYSMQDLGLEPGYENYPAYEQAIQDLIRREGLEPEYGRINKGEMLIWHANLLHGGAPQTDLSRSRHSQVTHYYFEGCRYYTPMESSADRFKYRSPEWIPEQPWQPPGPVRHLLRRIKRRLLR